MAKMNAIHAANAEPYASARGALYAASTEANILWRTKEIFPRSNDF